MYDIYLLPPGEDSETCQSWLRMRNRDGRYNLMFEAWNTDGDFVVSPRINFEARFLFNVASMSVYQDAHLVERCTGERAHPGGPHGAGV